jgi:hypothetical protein
MKFKTHLNTVPRLGEATAPASYMFSWHAQGQLYSYSSSLQYVFMACTGTTLFSQAVTVELQLYYTTFAKAVLNPLAPGLSVWYSAERQQF